MVSRFWQLTHLHIAHGELQKASDDIHLTIHIDRHEYTGSVDRPDTQNRP